MNVKIMNTQQVKDHIMKKFRRFVKLDERILSKITEILFYSILYVLFSIYVGILINSIFPNFDDKKNDLAILIEVLLQSSLTAVSVFYIRRFVNLIPFPILFGNKYLPNEAINFTGEVMFSVVFVSTQVKIIEKIAYLSKLRVPITASEDTTV
tara:strand:- start:1499 stop:1957 length:459 start_codon:yes stop_codon:yes gene_type:complete